MKLRDKCELTVYLRGLCEHCTAAMADAAEEEAQVKAAMIASLRCWSGARAVRNHRARTRRRQLGGAAR